MLYIVSYTLCMWRPKHHAYTPIPLLPYISLRALTPPNSSHTRTCPRHPNDPDADP